MNPSKAHTHSPAPVVQAASTRGGHSTATPHVGYLLAFSNLRPRRPRGQVLGLSLREAGRKPQGSEGREPSPPVGMPRGALPTPPALHSEEEVAADGAVCPCYQPLSSISLMFPPPVCLSSSKWSRVEHGSLYNNEPRCYRVFVST